jgi:hypothetical protein
VSQETKAEKVDQGVVLELATALCRVAPPDSPCLPCLDAARRVATHKAAVLTVLARHRNDL